MTILTKNGLIFKQTSTYAAGAVDSVFGRTGDVVANDGDYSLDQMADVDMTTAPPVATDFLAWDGSKWVPEDTVDGGTYA